MTDPAELPSWDAARSQAPERPQLAPSLVEESPIDRPRRLILALVCVVAAAAVWAVMTALAALRLEDITDTLTVALTAELAEEYEDGDLHKAVRVLLGLSAGLGGVLTLVQVLSARACVIRRSLPARIAFVVVTILAVPVVLFAPVLYDGDTRDTALSVVVVVAVLAAALLMCSPAASKWLRQSPDAQRASLTDLTDEVGPVRSSDG